MGVMSPLLALQHPPLLPAWHPLPGAGRIPSISCLPHGCGSCIPIPTDLCRSVISLFFLFFFFFHRAQMGIKLRPLNSSVLAAIMGLQAAFHHQLVTAAACLRLENRSMLAPAAGAWRAAACSLPGPCAGSPCGKAALGLNPTRPNHTRAIFFSCERARGQKTPARGPAAMPGPKPHHTGFTPVSRGCMPVCTPALRS